MTDDEAFRDLIRRVRAGDQAAAADLVRRYEPEIRRVVRLRLGDSRLNRVLDSIDVCQSVLGNVFVRIAAGQYDLDDPGQLLRLLATMARNKVIDHARKPANRPVPITDSALDGRPDRGRERPDQAAEGRELLAEVRRRLTDDERRVFDLRRAGADWAGIAAAVGGGPDAARKRYERAMDRVTRELGIGEES